MIRMCLTVISGQVVRHSPRAALELDPHFYLSRIFLGLTYIQMGLLGKAAETLAQALDDSEAHPGPVSALAAVYSLSGEERKSEDALAHLRQLTQGRHVSPYYLALASLGSGDTEAALECLEVAYQARSGWLVNLNVEPSMDPLRSHPRFQELLRRMAFPN